MSERADSERLEQRENFIHRRYWGSNCEKSDIYSDALFVCIGLQDAYRKFKHGKNAYIVATLLMNLPGTFNE